MARSENQKLKLLYLIKFLREWTDEEHGLTLEQVVEKLKGEGIEAERKSLYSDMELLRDFGIDVVKYKKNRTWYYAWVDREYDVAEIKLLVDAVWSSKFITSDTSRRLVKKLGAQLSRHEAAALERQVYVTDRVKTMNEKGLYNVDAIHDAMASNVRISFDYKEWNEDKQLVARKDGRKTDISPWMLLWENSNYYLVAYDPAKGAMRHYRVDKMDRVELSKEPREGKELYDKKGPESYSQKRFQMFDGEPEAITLSCHKSLLGAFFDSFGTDISVRDTEEKDWYEVRVNAAPTRLFLGWIFGLGEDVRILRPAGVVDKMNTWLQSGLRRHEKRTIRNVIFDLGMVLVDFRYDAYMKELKFPKERRVFFEKHIILSELWKEMDGGSLSQAEAVETFVTRYPEQEPWIRRFFENPVRLVKPYADTSAWLTWCKENGYGTYLLTNYPEEIYELHANKVFRFLSLVDGCVVSAKEHVSKPSEDIYRILLKRHGLVPEECVFLDDRRENVEAAEALGIHGILVKHRETAWQELKDFLAANKTI